METLNASPLIAQCDIVKRDETAQRAFYKVRCSLLVKPYKLELKLIVTETELIFAYQLFSTKALIRWDNEPHFPTLASFPHHFHTATEEVTASPLTGNPDEDINQVLREFSIFLAGPPA
jgi:hypothetical protein